MGGYGRNAERRPSICTIDLPTFAHRVLFSLDYEPMKRLNLITYAGLAVLVALLSGCSAPEETSGSSNTNGTQANSNAASEPQIAQGNAPAVQPIPTPPVAPSVGAANANAAIAPASAADSVRAPKLVVSAAKIDFGKQPQDKTLVRALVVKNGGREDLKIESVVPS